MANKLMKTVDVVLGLLVMMALINVGTAAWFDFNIVEWVFRFHWLIMTVYTIVSVFGLIWAIQAVARLLMK